MLFAHSTLCICTYYFIFYIKNIFEKMIKDSQFCYKIVFYYIIISRLVLLFNYKFPENDFFLVDSLFFQSKYIITDKLLISLYYNNN